jgi:molybdate transport system substrate-binding protein
VTPKSYEEKVKGVVTKVTVGEADTGIVFVTDVIAAGDAAAGVPIPADVNAISNYPIVVTKEAPNAAAAQAFVDFVASAEGQAILAKYGFLPA